MGGCEEEAGSVQEGHGGRQERGKRARVGVGRKEERGKFVKAGGCVDKGYVELDLEFMSGK